ncbi:MAG TPA: sigma-70 family RNA polymerase sigma factor [Terriglobales bacterium]
MNGSRESWALSFPVLRGRAESRKTESLPEEDQITDERLLIGVRDGDQTSLHVLFDHFSRLVFHIALRILRDHGEAEEIVQDVFFNIHQHASTFDIAKGSAKAWIAQMAYHRALDRRLYLYRRQFYVGTDADSVANTLAGDTDLDREIGSQLDRAQLEKAFEELPSRQRRTLELFYFEGLELREISERLGEPLSNVRHHYYRGLAKLRKSAFIQKMREK